MDFFWESGFDLKLKLRIIALAMQFGRIIVTIVIVLGVKREDDGR